MAPTAIRTFPGLPDMGLPTPPTPARRWARMPTTRAPTPRARLDPERAAAFSHWMHDVIEDGALVLLLSIGHRTGLFDVMAGRPPSTARQIAEAAGLRPCYVRDWLDAMVAAGIVVRDPASALHHLPGEHAASLAGLDAKTNLAALAQHVCLRAADENRILACFQEDGVVPYEACAGFQGLAATASSRAVVEALRESVLSLVPGLVDALKVGVEVLQLGCGDGRVLELMARIFPRSRFRGTEPCAGDFERARHRAFLLGLNNVDFVATQTVDLDECEQYDLVLDFDGIHEQVRVATILAHVSRALRPGGILLMQEGAAASLLAGSPAVASGRALASVCRMHGRSESATGETAIPGAMWGEMRTRRLLRAAGFERVSVRRSPQHIQNCCFVAFKG